MLPHAETHGQYARKLFDFSQAGAEFVAFPKYYLSRSEHSCVSVPRKGKFSAARGRIRPDSVLAKPIQRGCHAAASLLL
jgi:hypothetical protein